MKKKIILTIILILIIISLIIIFPKKEKKTDDVPKGTNGIPKVYITGNILDMQDKSDIRNVEIKYVSDDINFESYATLKLQGNSTLQYPKKNYNLKLYNDKNRKEKNKVDVGYGNEYKYCLKANYVDKSHSRNIVTASIIADIQKKYNLFEDTPNYGVIDGFPVEVYNNNAFLGLYTFNIPKDEWMLNLDSNNENHIALMPKETINEKFHLYDSYNVIDNWEFEAGSEANIDKFNRVLRFVIDSTDEEFKTNFEKYFNLDATLNYYVMLEAAMLLDNIDRNIIMVTYDGIIWYPSHYDLEVAWGSNWNGLKTHKYNTNIEDYFGDNLFFIKFQRSFSKEIAERYFELRKDIITSSYILNKFEEFTKLIPEETLTLEKEKWELRGYDINQIKGFLEVRIPIIDKKMKAYLEE